MKKSGKDRIKTLLKFFGPALFLVLLLRVVDTRAVADLLKTARLDMILASGVLFLALLAVLAARWLFICRQLKMGCSYRTLFEISYAAWFLGSLPLSGTSALAKIIYLKDSGESATKAAVSVVFDKLADMGSLVLFALFGGLYLPTGLINSGLSWFLWSVAALAATVCICLGSQSWNSVRRVSDRYLGRRLQKLGNGLESNLAEFWAGLSPKLVATHFILAIVIGLLRSTVLYILALSIGIQVSFLLILACRAFIGIVNIVPVSISGLGTRDSVLLLVLPLAGVSLEPALTLGFLAFLWTVITKLSGAIFWVKRPLPFRGIDQIRKTLFSSSNIKG